LSKLGLFMIAYKQSIAIYNSKTFEAFENLIKVPLAKSKTSDIIEIMRFEVSQNQELLAVLAGKNLIKEEEELHQIFIYKIDKD